MYCLDNTCRGNTSTTSLENGGVITMKLLKAGIGLSLMSVLALNVNGESVAMAQDDEDTDTEEVEEDVEVEEGSETETDEETSEVNTDEAIDLETLLEEGYAAQENLETLYLETAITVVAAEMENESVTREWYKQEGDVILSRTEIENPDGSLTTIINDGKEAITYTDGQEQAFRTVIPQPEDVEIEEDAETEDVEGEEETEVEGVKAPEVAPATISITASAYLESLQDIYDISVEGTEQVGDRDAYKVNLEPIEDSEYSAYASPTSMWIDAEHYIILKQEIDDGTGSEIGSEFVTMEVNEEFEDTLFELELPEGVEIVDDMQLEDIEVPEDGAAEENATEEEDTETEDTETEDEDVE